MYFTRWRFISFVSLPAMITQWCGCRLRPCFLPRAARDGKPGGPLGGDAGGGGGRWGGGEVRWGSAMGVISSL